ncbi:lysophospholipid acyltransferase family protein [Zymomonas mobilis]|uniref:Phospholipid/glycerol acyltransferase n=1 Tax=Zymomonas mobilis subsp. pomaceae (strain ATCC 29192 / DSM 22645 / JCM 10191 / CCUG 17912 / NBRC 13757 / NCIMB 11200 / NRRL B-4491 / Barker I) TaxID=579138 RepID=F8ESB5_ZYMMT|nr:lysophospholipid acyltransferase family protein [Zymomonas mobilis]AEI37690.1 phospholipid/glycerol acyltransferase [Zymomonas mobilis subsp. pomaceae ATCC 29192]MDX5949057.1 lysophospholipid acyltransferase family protein [Zymomonas mobilis subsp. pomaceae]GEB88862.1 1-acyl-sn-glycerol-3-phosphate acyltransferase [Zymomonas mobilis subsp. pomaceae]
MIAKLRAALFLILFYSATVFMIFMAFPLLLGKQSAMWRQANRWARLHSFLARYIIGIRSEWHGVLPTEKLAKDAVYLIVAKHESMFETLELVRFLGHPAIILKRELVDLPLFGRLLQAHGAIPVDRTGSAVALRRMLRAAGDAQKQGRSLLLFPEGTRVAHGEMPPLRSGFFGLYKMLKLPVIPIALDSGLLWKTGLNKKSGIVHFQVGEVIPAGLPRKEAEARVHKAINQLNDPFEKEQNS